MGGVWHFGSDGVARLVSQDVERGKVLVYRPTNEIIQSYAELQQRLAMLGWRRLGHEQAGTVQFVRGSSAAIVLPADFRHLRLLHMLDIVMQNLDYFHVTDA